MEAFKNDKNLKKFKKAIKLLKEIEVDGEDMDILVESLGMEDYLLRSLMVRESAHDIMSILAMHGHPLARRFDLISSEVNYISEHLSETVRHSLIDGDAPLLTLFSNILYMCDHNCTEVDEWKTREELGREKSQWNVTVREVWTKHKTVTVKAHDEEEAKELAWRETGNMEAESELEDVTVVDVIKRITG